MPKSKHQVKSKNLPGRQKDRLFSAEDEQAIGRRHLRGESAVTIAASYQCNPKSIYRLIKERLRPLWREVAKRPQDELMAEVAEIRRCAWKGYQDTFSGILEETVKEALADAVKGGKVSLGIVEKVTRKLPNNTAAAWLAVLQWCADFEAKIYGYYAPSRSQINIQGDFRVAGFTPDQVNKENLEKLDAAIKRGRAREAELRALGLGPN